MLRLLGKRLNNKAKYFKRENTVWIQKRMWNERRDMSNEITVLTKTRVL